jgi:hypothetical protein
MPPYGVRPQRAMQVLHVVDHLQPTSTVARASGRQVPSGFLIQLQKSGVSSIDSATYPRV